MALTIAFAAVLPSMLQRLGENGYYFTFNIYGGILLTALLGWGILSAILLCLLWAEKRWDLLRFWVPRILASVILVNLTLRILQGASDLEGVQLLQKFGIEEDPARWWRRIRSVFYVVAIGLLAWKTRPRGSMGPVFRLFLLVLACFSGLAFLRAAPAMIDEAKAPLSFSAKTAAHPDRSVVWVIFDELDYVELEKALAAGSVPNFASFREASLQVTRARSPASSTLYSIPQLLSGLRMEKVEVSRFDLMVKPAGSESAVPVGTVDNVLASVLRQYGSVQLRGFYHPYCRLFRELTDCRSVSISNIPGVSTVLVDGARTLSLSSSDRLMELAGLRPDDFGADWRDRMSWVTAQQIRTIEHEFSPGTAALHFLHLNLPHRPASKIAERRFGYTPETIHEVDWYSVNLRLADEVLGEIMRKVAALPDESEVLVVISGDHGRRPEDWDRSEETGAELIRHVPFLARTNDSNKPMVLDAEVDVRATRVLVEHFLDGKIRGLADMAPLLRSSAVAASKTANR